MEQYHVVIIASQAAYLMSCDTSHRSCRVVESTCLDIDAPLHACSTDEIGAFANDLAAKIATLRPEGLTCKMVIPASWSFCHEVSLPEGAWSEQAAAFEFENAIPYELESLTCSFWPGSPGQGIVAGVLTEPIGRMLEILERSSVSVTSLLVDAVVQSHGCKGEDDNASILVDEGRLTIAYCSPAEPTERFVRTICYPSNSDISIIEGRLNAILATMHSIPSISQLWIQSDDPHTRLVVSLLDTIGLSLAKQPQSETIESLAKAACSGSAPLDLRRDTLSYAGRWSLLTRKATYCGVAFVCLLAAWAISLQLSASHLSADTESLLTMRNTVYQSVYPGQPAPPGASLRLRSECIKLEGLTQGDTGDNAALSQAGAEPLQRLCSVVAGIPAGAKVYVKELVVDNRLLKISGQTTAHNVAGSIVQALNQIGSIEVDPPRTKLRKDKTVDFRIQVKRKKNEKP